MASIQENLQTARENLAAQLAAVTASSVMSYSTPGGVAISKGDYVRLLLDAIKDLDDQIGDEAGQSYVFTALE